MKNHCKCKCHDKEDDSDYEEDLYGHGLFDMFIKQDSLKSSSQKIVNQFGDFPIVKLQIYRTPVMSMLKSFLNVISLGKFKSATQSYDDLFHLAMIATVKLSNGTLKNIVIEKNATVNVSTSYKTDDKTQAKDVDLRGKSFTIKQLFKETLNKISTKRFYLYDAFNSDGDSGNCQRFIIDILASNGLITQELDSFINQNAQDIVKGLGTFSSKIVPTVTRAITDIGAIFGAGNDDGYMLHAVVVRTPVSAEEINRIHNEFFKDNKRHFMRETKLSIRMRNIPKNAFEPKSFRSKKINSKITLVYGKLKPEMMKKYMK